MRKRIHMFFVMICICLGMLYPGNIVQAAQGKTAVSVSSGTVNVGDTVTVSVSASSDAGESAVATMTVSWDAGILQLAGCSTTYGGGGGSIRAVGDKFTVTLTAISAGTSNISVSGTDGVVFNTDEELESMAGSSTSVTVNNAVSNEPAGGGTAGGNTGGGTAGGNTAGGNGGTGGETATGAPLSADNSLKSLTISPGTLSPSFTGRNVNYSATVANNVTSIAVSAQTANEKAAVESVTGNEGLKVGVNAIKIVVRAENGVTATYTINVTRQAEGSAPAEGTTPENPEENGGETDPDAPEEHAASVMVNGAPYQIVTDFPAEEIPADFTENTILYHGTEHRGVSFINGSVSMLMLTPAESADGTGRFFVYDEMRDGLYPFVKLGDGGRYVIALWAPVDFAMPENYHQAEITVRDGETMTAYQVVAPEESEIGSDFYLFYAVNSDGTENWYQYDSMEGTYQRLNTAAGISAGEENGDGTLVDDSLQEDYDALAERYKETRRNLLGIIGILVFVAAVLLLLLINQLVHRFKNRGNRMDDEDDEDDLWDEDGELLDGTDEWNAAVDGEDWQDDFPDEESGEDTVPRRRGLFRKRGGRTEAGPKDDRVGDTDDDPDEWNDIADEESVSDDPDGWDDVSDEKPESDDLDGGNDVSDEKPVPKTPDKRNAATDKKFASEAVDEWDDTADEKPVPDGPDNRDAATDKKSVPKVKNNRDILSTGDDRQDREAREDDFPDEESGADTTPGRRGFFRKKGEPAKAVTEDDWPKDDWLGDDWPEDTADDADGRSDTAEGKNGPDDVNERAADAVSKNREPAHMEQCAVTGRPRSGGNAAVPAGEELMEEPSAKASGRFGGNLTAEEYAERRAATERFFAEEPAKKSFWHKDAPGAGETRQDRKAAAAQKNRSAAPAKPAVTSSPAKAASSAKSSSATLPSKKKEGKKPEAAKTDGGFEVIDFNDL